MTPQTSHPEFCSMQWWQKVAKRIRVPLGFLTAALYVAELWRHAPRPSAVLWSLLLVLPGLWLRAYASGYVKKNAELAVTGPYAHTRNPLYLGSMLMAAGFAVAIESWAVAAVLACGFALIYIPVIAGEEKFLRSAFAGFDDYCRQVPRLLPRLTPAHIGQNPADESQKGSFSFVLYRQHREYNAAIGVVLLYLCLECLRPVFVTVLHLAR
ncbi:methyltransferase family protein [Telmatobacter bradus]|uniref:methyltransferase family protein n=1 Tax=Telmatobacter bradus TaxID=474953 RepID=UPI003B43B464